MKAILLIALLLWSGAASAQVQHIGGRHYEDARGGASSVLAHTYQGTSNTLPYGHVNGWDAGLITHALTMPSVQQAMDAMARRGYVRRTDLDAGMTVDGYANVVLAYEKPGAPVSERLPTVTVVTQPFYVSSSLRWVPATQVACGMFEDSAGVLRPVSTAADSAIVMESEGGVNPLAPGALEAAITAASRADWWSDEEINYRYTAHDHYFPQDWRETTSRGMQQLWSRWGEEMGLTMTESAIRSSSSFMFMPPAQAGMSMAGSAIVSCWAAHVRFWMYPPDTTGGQ